VTHNDVLRSLRYVLRVDDAGLSAIVALGGYPATPEQVAAWLKREDDPGFREVPEDVMARFLNGLVYFKRGRDESRPPLPVDVPVTNNSVLKKVRVAFELKDTDIVALIEKAGPHRVSKAELGAFFRARGHRNYRECGDQFLRNLLKALAQSS
jgi:uncharacterized protein YehS (DUF1456 family)